MNIEEIETQEISQKQLVLIDKLIQTSKLTMTERNYIVDKTRGRLKTTYDGKILIEHLLGKINFEKHFNGGKIFKKAKCQWCENKVGLKRYINAIVDNRIWLCEDCRKKANENGFYLAAKKKRKSGKVWDGSRNDEQLSVAEEAERQEKFCN